MKIAFVAPAYPYRGGISHFATRLANQLNSEHECLFINFKRLYPGILFPGKTQFDESSSHIEFQSERIIDPLNPVSWFSAGQRIRNWGADAVVFHWWHPFFGPAYDGIIRRLKGIRKVAICHNVLPHDRGSGWRWITRKILKRFDGLIIHARSEEAVLKNVFPGLGYTTLFHPIYDVFPGSEISRSEARKMLKIDDKTKMLLYFGLIRRYKGVQVLLDAIPLIGEIPDLKAFVVGEIYADREELERRISGLSDKQVQLIDKYVPNEEVAFWFRACDLVALPYLSATQSGVIPIAYACNRPVLATSVGGLPEVVDEGRSGYIVQPGNSEALAAKVTEHFIKLNNPDMTDGINEVKKRLGWESYAAKLAEFIENPGQAAHD